MLWGEVYYTNDLLAHERLCGIEMDDVVGQLRLPYLLVDMDLYLSEISPAVYHCCPGSIRWVQYL